MPIRSHTCDASVCVSKYQYMHGILLKDWFCENFVDTQIPLTMSRREPLPWAVIPNKLSRLTLATFDEEGNCESIICSSFTSSLWSL